jgi:hypothetical protein
LQEGRIQSCPLLHASVSVDEKNHFTEERGEEFVSFFVLREGIKLAERWVDVAIAVNKGKQ